MAFVLSEAVHWNPRGLKFAFENVKNIFINVEHPDFVYPSIIIIEEGGGGGGYPMYPLKRL